MRRRAAAGASASGSSDVFLTAYLALFVSFRFAGEAGGAKVESEKPLSAEATKKFADRAKDAVVESKLEDQFTTGRLLACISSRPGQSGRMDGYILEGPELEFYQRKLAIKKTGKAKA
jgi:small subunit ribosomal protein S8e